VLQRTLGRLVQIGAHKVGRQLERNATAQGTYTANATLDQTIDKRIAAPEFGEEIVVKHAHSLADFVATDFFFSVDGCHFES
jgi:hypothetical protein